MADGQHTGIDGEPAESRFARVGWRRSGAGASLVLAMAYHRLRELMQGAREVTRNKKTGLLTRGRGFCRARQALQVRPQGQKAAVQQFQ